MSIIKRVFSVPVVLGGALASLAIGGVTNLATQPAQAATGPGCSPRLALRTPEQTIREHLQHMTNWQLNHDSSEFAKAMCDYAENATVVLPQPTNNQVPATGTVVSGLDKIQAGLQSILCFLGPNAAPPTVLTLTESHNQVLITFTASGAPCSIPDGSDTYSVLLGHIVTQTVHDTLSCSAPPPPECFPSN